ncbi:hypothetical protein FNF29_01272 [Cafeteria roenbergensis]|uniref:Inositol polyphosphate-related phosphatase domain-containing protein n=1 Tax=Cafeteria roenbergensis TaxID=33653 RepID=A0A5A8CRU9_CAFRO|nr:hypothetical protein FNF29_01272 [Cafeteria roenbergensis]|eukprot:KAA0155852.1 hypothetical protein FNF29_01272 [Cafeteria roenbergensis]
MAARTDTGEWDAASVESHEGERTSIERLQIDEDDEAAHEVVSAPVGAGSPRSVGSGRGTPSAAAAADESNPAMLQTALAASVKEWAAAGYTPDALGFLADELVSLRQEQTELRQSVDALGGRMDAAVASIMARLASIAGPATPTGRRSPATLLDSAVHGMRPSSPSGVSRLTGEDRAGSPSQFGPRGGDSSGPARPAAGAGGSAPSSAGAASAQPPPSAAKHRFAAPLGISTSGTDDSPRVPVHIWAGTWNLGAAEPVGGAKGCSREDLCRFAAPGYDLYVLGVQEGMSDAVYEEFAAATGTVRLSLTDAQKRGGVASSSSGPMAVAGPGVGTDTPGVPLSSALSSSAAAGQAGIAQGSKAADADKVLGRGDGSLVSLKFTGIAVFAAHHALPYVRVMRADRLSFGATEGSKGAVAAVVRVHRSTLAFVSVHLASHKVPARLVQYRDVCKSLGAKLGNSFFQLNEQFHHVVFMGDFNYRCERIGGEEALALIRRGAAHSRLLPLHDSMLRHRAETGAWDGYDEPPMAPTLWPTYKKYEQRPLTDTTVDGWAAGVYRIKFREPVYKGGRVMDRVPGWCDRVLARSHPHLRPYFFPLTRDEAERVASGAAPDDAESFSEPQRRAASSLALPAWALSGAAEPLDYGEDGADIDPRLESSYDSVNDVLTVSDHSPVRCVFRLLAFRDPMDDFGDGLDAVPVCLRDAVVAAASAAPGAAAAASAVADGAPGSPVRSLASKTSPLMGPSSGVAAASAARAAAVSAPPSVEADPDGRLSSASSRRSSQLTQPAPRIGSASLASVDPGAVTAAVHAVLRIDRIELVRGEGSVLVPQVAKLLCPAPFELDDGAPAEVRVVKTKAGLSATVTLSTRAPAALPRLHAILKVQVDRSTKGHCVVPLRPLFAALDASGRAEHSFFAPIASDGISKAGVAVAPAHAQFQASLQLRRV